MQQFLQLILGVLTQILLRHNSLRWCLALDRISQRWAVRHTALDFWALLDKAALQLERYFAILGLTIILPYASTRLVASIRPGKKPQLVMRLKGNHTVDLRYN
jgi:hypothetical protein